MWPSRLWTEHSFEREISGKRPSALASKRAIPALAFRGSSKDCCAMCERYATSLPAEAVARLFHTVNLLPNVAPSWNVAPRQQAMVVRRHPETGERHLDLLKWGLLPSWTKDPAKAQRPINCRSETIATSVLFLSPFKARHASCRRTSSMNGARRRPASSLTLSRGRMDGDLPCRKASLPCQH